MTSTVIPDDELIAVANVVTIWVAAPEAPTDIWSLAEAVAWVLGQPGAPRFTLFRPPGEGTRAAWVHYEQIERLAFALAREQVSDAA